MRIRNGEAAIHRRKRLEAEQRAARFGALRLAVQVDLEPELLAHADVECEQPNLFPEFILCIDIPGCAQIRALYHWRNCDGWQRIKWDGSDDALWVIMPTPGAPRKSWVYSSDLDEALAIAAGLGVSYHAVALLAEQKTAVMTRPRLSRTWQMLRGLFVG